jgi:hypothetical protein
VSVSDATLDISGADLLDVMLARWLHATHGSAGAPVEIDLTGVAIDTWDQLWHLLDATCGLPDAFGRDLDAWSRALRGGVSLTLDTAETVTIRVSAQGLFAPGADGTRFVDLTNASPKATVEITPH